MKKTILITAIAAAFAGIFIVITHVKKTITKTCAYTLGILQTASHPALDASRDGFIEELKNTLGVDVECIVQNAQGSISQAHTIAQQFHASEKYDGFFAIATPAAQAMGVLEHKRPVFIAAVTDPDALGLMHSATNVCGTKDMINVKAGIEMLTQLIPHAQTVGLLYTSGEINSVILVKQMHLELETQGLKCIDFAVSNETDMQAMVESACRKVDVILAPTDNIVASTITLIADVTRKNKKPLIVSDNMLVKYGALAAKGVDYKASGTQTAQIAYKVLIEGRKPHELPIEQVTSEQIFINQTTLDLLGLTIPKILEKCIVLV
jgi:putative tryptophan/tyrosine transport system substrate-binding protein